MKRIEFKIPKGLTAPEGTQAGDQWQEMATFRMKPNGMMCLVAIGEHKMPGYENGKSDESESPMEMMQSKATTRYGAAMGGMSPGGSY